VLGHKRVDGKDMFLVHWKGYDRPSDHTWEPLENLFGCLELVAQFNARKGTSAPPRDMSDASVSSRSSSSATASGDSESDSDPEPPRRTPKRPPVQRRQVLRRPLPKPIGPRSPRSPRPCEPVMFPASIPTCDRWFTECFFDEMQGKRQPQIAAVVAARRHGLALFFECLFDTGERLWMSARETQCRAPELLRQYLESGHGC
jgi:hypothetical protein